MEGFDAQFAFEKKARPEEMFRNAMLIGSLRPHPASINSINIRFKTKKNLKPYSHFSLTPYSLLNKAMIKLE